MAILQQSLIYGDLGPSEAAIQLLNAQDRSQAIPRQYNVGSFVYDVDDAGNFVPNTIERTFFYYSTNDAVTTSLEGNGYLGTLADFPAGQGVDQSILVSTDWKGGNYAPDGLASLVLGWSVIIVGEPRWNSTVAAASANRAVPFGGSAINTLVNSIPTSIVSRSEQLVRNAFRGAVGMFLPNGNSNNCGLRAGKVQLNPGAAGQDSDSIPQSGAKNGRASRFRLREAVPTPGADNPNVNYNRFQLRFGTATAGSTTSSSGQQVIVEKAPGDPALTSGSSVIIDYLVVTDVAIILPERVMRPFSVLQPDGTQVIEQRETWMGYRPQDRALIDAYECWK